MADSRSLRVKRHRLHARGDHSLCKRCDARRAQTASLAEAWDRAAIPAAMEPAEPFAGSLDPGKALEGLARRLAVAHEADPADAALARELRMTLLALGGQAGAGDDDRAKFWAEFRGGS